MTGASFILDTRALKKQLGKIDSRLAELIRERDELTAHRDACALLLRQAEQPPAVPVAVVAPTPLASLVMGGAVVPPPSLPEAIRRLLATQRAGLTADQIYDELKARGFALPRSRPVREVYSALENHTDLFLEAEEGRWVLKAESVAGP